LKFPSYTGQLRPRFPGNLWIFGDIRGHPRLTPHDSLLIRTNVFHRLRTRVVAIRHTHSKYLSIGKHDLDGCVAFQDRTYRTAGKGEIFSGQFPLHLDRIKYVEQQSGSDPSFHCQTNGHYCHSTPRQCAVIHEDLPMRMTSRTKSGGGHYCSAARDRPT